MAQGTSSNDNIAAARISDINNLNTIQPVVQELDTFDRCVLSSPPVLSMADHYEPPGSTVVI